MATSTSNEENIVISLEGSTKSGSIVQHRLLHEIAERILTDVRKQAEGERKNGYPDAFDNLCYLVNGRRGDGKSFFLNKLEEELTRERGEFRMIKLLTCDPSMMSPSYHFLLSVIAAINSRLDILEQSDNGYCHDGGIAECRKKVEDLTPGVVRLVTPDKYRQEIDEYQVSEMREDSCEFPGQMKKKFAEIVKQLCTLYKANAMLITIDDAEIHTKQCIEVMESIRLCLACPKCVIVLTGDLNVYSNRLSEYFLLQHNQHYLDVVDNAKTLCVDEAHHASDQYMLKIIPADRRYALENLHDIYKRESVYIYHNGTKMDLSDILVRILMQVLHKDGEYLKKTEETLTNLGMRSFINMLNRFDIDKIVSESGDETTGVAEITENFIDALKTTVGNILCVKGYNFNQIENNRIYLYKYIIKYCSDINERDLSNTSNAKQQLKLAALILFAYARLECLEMKGLLSFMLFGPATVRLMYDLYGLCSNGNGTFAKFVSDFESYINTDNRNNPLFWANRASILLSYSPKNRFIESGVFILRSKESCNAVAKVMQYREMREGDILRKIRKISALSCSIIKSQSDSFTRISPYMLYAYVLNSMIDIDTMLKAEDFSNETKSNMLKLAHSAELKGTPDLARNIRILAGEDVGELTMDDSISEITYEKIIALSVEHGSNLYWHMKRVRACISSIAKTLISCIKFPAVGMLPSWIPVPRASNEEMDAMPDPDEVNRQNASYRLNLDSAATIIACDMINWYMRLKKKNIAYAELPPGDMANLWNHIMSDINRFGRVVENKAKDDITGETALYAYARSLGRDRADIYYAPQFNIIIQALNEAPLCKAFQDFSDDLAGYLATHHSSKRRQ